MSEGGRPRRGRSLHERLGRRPEGQHSPFGCALRPRRPPGVGPRAPVVVVVDRRLTRCDQGMVGHDAPEVDETNAPAHHMHLDGPADEACRCRVAGGAEADAGELVHLAGRDLADLWSERGQAMQERPLRVQPDGGHCSDLGVLLTVQLLAPPGGLCVGCGEVCDRHSGRDHEVALRIADQVLDHRLRLGVVPLAEVRAEPVVGGEADVVGGRHDDVHHHPALQAPHPIREDHLRHPADHLEALGQHGERRLGRLIRGEAHEADAAPRQHSAEDMQRADRSPVDDERLAGRPHARPASPAVLPAPLGLRGGHQPAEVARRAGKAGCPGLGQEALRGDPALGRLHSLGHDVAHAVGVARPVGPGRGLGPLCALDGTLHGLRVDAAEGCGTSVAAHVGVGGDHVHLLPR